MFIVRSSIFCVRNRVRVSRKTLSIHKYINHRYYFQNGWKGIFTKEKNAFERIDSDSPKRDISEDSSKFLEADVM